MNSKDNSHLEESMEEENEDFTDGLFCLRDFTIPFAKKGKERRRKKCRENFVGVRPLLGDCPSLWKLQMAFHRAGVIGTIPQISMLRLPTAPSLPPSFLSPGQKQFTACLVKSPMKSLLYLRGAVMCGLTVTSANSCQENAVLLVGSAREGIIL